MGIQKQSAVSKLLIIKKRHPHRCLFILPFSSVVTTPHVFITSITQKSPLQLLQCHCLLTLPTANTPHKATLLAFYSSDISCYDSLMVF